MSYPSHPHSPSASTHSSSSAHSHKETCPFTGQRGDHHAYCPPQPGDSRSPCPALNTLANHGYLPRDGKCITPEKLTHGLRKGYNLSHPLAWVLVQGGFYLLGQRRKRICLHDLSRHNCIEHNASLVHPDTEHRDEYAPIDVHIHMLEDLMKFSKDGRIMTPDDVASARVARELSYEMPMDSLHAEIARGEMAIVLHLFNNPSPEDDRSRSRKLVSRIHRVLTFKNPNSKKTGFPLPGVPNDFLRVWLHEERLPDGWKPYHQTGLLHTIRMSSRLRASMKKLAKEDKARRARGEAVEVDSVNGLAAEVKPLTINTGDRAPADVELEQGEVGDAPLSEPIAVVDHAIVLSPPGSPTSERSTAADSESPRTPGNNSLPLSRAHSHIHSRSVTVSTETDEILSSHVIKKTIVERRVTTVDVDSADDYYADAEEQEDLMDVPRVVAVC